MGDKTFNNDTEAIDAYRSYIKEQVLLNGFDTEKIATNLRETLYSFRTEEIQLINEHIEKILEDVVISGPQGLVGDQGDRGKQGLRGLIGESGKQGRIGEQGEIGPRGLIGESGKQGLVGDQGGRGLKGLVGPSGKQGLVGEQGQTFEWLGALKEQPSNPKPLQVYRNYLDKKVYLCNGKDWDVLVEDGEDTQSHWGAPGGGIGDADAIRLIQQYTTDGSIDAVFSSIIGDGSGITGITVSENYDTVGASATTDTNLTTTSTRLFVEHSVPFTVLGPASPTINTVYEIIDVNGIAGTTSITFDGNGKTIRGLSTWDLDADWYVLKIVYNGTNYNII